jgi:hypothetical protein
VYVDVKAAERAAFSLLPLIFVGAVIAVPEYRLLLRSVGFLRHASALAALLLGLLRLPGCGLPLPELLLYRRGLRNVGTLGGRLLWVFNYLAPKTA